ncbi:MAG: Rne/Rng family ribonuclease [Proteobacteria bacterium]|nr:Rne/Rng family ribonuclease [Pseudomonadota bacterium]
MAIDQILISKSPGETRIAFLSGGRLDGLSVVRTGRESIVGNIYLGRVEGALPGLDAAFIDIGLDRAGFLALPEARPPDSGAAGRAKDAIRDYANDGDRIVVQVRRDPIEDKGAKLTTHINLAGVTLVLRPGQPGVSVSRRITDVADRDRLTALAAALAPEGGGFIVRTAAATASGEAIERDARDLVSRWREIADKAQTAKPPQTLHTEPEAELLALRELGGEEIRKIVTDDAETHSRLRDFCAAGMGDLVSLIEIHKGRDSLFDAFGVEDQIDAALSPVVGLPGGGSIIISETPALNAIDVNTGAADAGSREQTAFEVDLEAAREVARQIRLRNLSGLIVVDFVPVRDAKRRRRLLDALKEAVGADPLGPHVSGFTPMGLVEMTRPRHGLSLLEIFGLPWPAAAAAPLKSPLTQALEALRRVLREAREAKSAALTLKAPPAVIEALKGPAAAALKEAEERLGLAIRLVADQTLADGQCDVIPGKGD